MHTYMAKIDPEAWFHETSYMIWQAVATAFAAVQPRFNLLAGVKAIDE